MFDPETKVWSGFKQPPLLNPEASLGQVLMALLKRTPNRVIQIDGDTGQVMTCEEMRLKTVRAAQTLEALGYRAGDMAALACTNSESLAPLVLGMLTLGMTTHLMSPSYGLDDLVHMMNITQPKLVICDGGNFETVRKAIQLKGTPELELYALECESSIVKKAEDLLQETGYEDFFLSPPHVGNSRETVAVVLCSSGTAGLNKAVCLSHAHLITLCGGSAMFMNSGIIFAFSPLFWGTGLCCLLLSLTIGDARLITRRPFSEDTFFELMQHYPVNIVCISPSYIHLLMRDKRTKTMDWSYLKVWVFVGSYVSENIRNYFDDLLPNGRSVIIYGLSETGTVAGDLFGRRSHSTGQLLPNVSAKIVDEVGTALSNGERGELLVQFREPLLGYYHNRTETAAALSEDGWFRTGDIALFDEDGYLYILDRKKDLIKYHGYHIAPADLEAIIERIAGVEQVSVAGLLAEDGCNDLPAAFIVKSPESDLNEEKVLQIVDDQVADYKRLRGGVFFASTLPRTENGKIIRRKLRENVQTKSKL
ncbi:uncharacterized protein LOC128746077 [Sabethes cyaneus]|uniref:uncharacterized protein LOC128746077 n=1 Tax=Sabethes cyaneus TaxID=53552 RepID=UPI00237EDFE1|nr:uncharacterized protein LOC128746077 [Sabethes cyaneus]